MLATENEDIREDWRSSIRKSLLLFGLQIQTQKTQDKENGERWMVTLREKNVVK